jgi:hypothetical protein
MISYRDKAALLFGVRRKETRSVWGLLQWGYRSLLFQRTKVLIISGLAVSNVAMIETRVKAEVHPMRSAETIVVLNPSNEIGEVYWTRSGFRTGKNHIYVEWGCCADSWSQDGRSYKLHPGFPVKDPTRESNLILPGYFVGDLIFPYSGIIEVKRGAGDDCVKSSCYIARRGFAHISQIQAVQDRFPNSKFWGGGKLCGIEFNPRTFLQTKIFFGPLGSTSVGNLLNFIVLAIRRESPASDADSITRRVRCGFRGSGLTISSPSVIEGDDNQSNTANTRNDFEHHLPSWSLIGTACGGLLCVVWGWVNFRTERRQTWGYWVWARGLCIWGYRIYFMLARWLGA